MGSGLYPDIVSTIWNGGPGNAGSGITPCLLRRLCGAARSSLHARSSSLLSPGSLTAPLNATDGHPGERRRGVSGSVRQSRHARSFASLWKVPHGHREGQPCAHYRHTADYTLWVPVSAHGFMTAATTSSATTSSTARARTNRCIWTARRWSMFASRRCSRSSAIRNRLGCSTASPSAPRWSVPRHDSRTLDICNEFHDLRRRQPATALSDA